MTAVETGKLTITKKGNTYLVKFQDLDFKLTATKSTHKFDTYCLPYYFEKGLAQLIDRELVEFWYLLEKGKLSKKEFKEFVKDTYLRLNEGLTKFIEKTEEIQNPPGKIKDYPFKFDRKDNLNLLKISHFLKLLAPILIKERYNVDYIDVAISEIAKLDQEIDKLIFKIFNLVKYKVKGLYLNRQAYMTFLKFNKSVDYNLITLELTRTVYDVIPYAYEVKNPVGYLISLMGKYVSFLFVENNDKEYTFFQLTESGTSTSLQKLYDSILLSLDLDKRILGKLSEEGRLNLSLLEKISNNYGKKWPKHKFFLVPYLIAMGYKYHQINLAQNKALVAYFLIQKEQFVKRFPLISKILRSEPVESLSLKVSSKNFINNKKVTNFARRLKNDHLRYIVNRNSHLLTETYSKYYDYLEDKTFIPDLKLLIEEYFDFLFYLDKISKKED